MSITLVKTLARCAFFELESDSCYCHEAYTVSLGGVACGTFRENCFALYELTPDSLYEVCVQYGEQRETLSFRTAAESAFLPVTRFGAIGDGKTDCTNAIQAAIACCPANGTVYIPAGCYVSYALFLKSDITLYLARGAVLMGGTKHEKYPILPGMIADEAHQNELNFGTWEGNPLSCHASLITAMRVSNVSICGQGEINGNAQASAWWDNVKMSRAVWRPRTLFFNGCTDVTVLGVTVCNSPSWTVHPYYCDRVDILDVTVRNPDDSPNTDGIDVESCTDVHIFGCLVSVGDDCIVIKSGKYYMAKHHLKPSENIDIRNCCLERGHGGVVVGSEVSGGVRGLTIEQCLLRNTDRGLRVKTRRGRGKDSVLTEILCRKLSMQNVKSAFVINMFYFCDPDGKTEYVYSKKPLPDDGMLPHVGAITLRDIHCVGCSVAGVFFYGLPEAPIEQVTMENVYIAFRADAQPDMAAMMDELEPMCKVGIFAANVNALRMHQVTLEGYEGERVRLSNVKTEEAE